MPPKATNPHRPGVRNPGQRALGDHLPLEYHLIDNAPDATSETVARERPGRAPDQRTRAATFAAQAPMKTTTAIRKSQVFSIAAVTA